jgi:hypothetical protein
MLPRTQTYDALLAGCMLTLLLLGSVDKVFPSDDHDIKTEKPKDPLVCFVVSGIAGAALMSESDGIEGKAGWYIFGSSAELSLASAGLSPFLQIGYLAANKYWHHLVPIEFGGRYAWRRGGFFVFLSGGMSLLAIDKKTNEESAEQFSNGWEVVPVIYMDVGSRLMIKRHFGFDLRFVWRTYAVINLVAMQGGLIF